MILVVDASVAVKWVVDEDGRQEARDLIASDDDLIAPSIVLAEVGNALWKKVRLKEIDGEQARRALAEVVIAYGRIEDSAKYAAAALELAVDHPIYDCFYLACALASRAQLVTADSRLVAALAGTSYAHFARAISA